MQTEKFPTLVRVGGFFLCLLINFLIASLAFHWPLVLRIAIAIPIGLAGGIMSYGAIPTKERIAEIKLKLRTLGKHDEANDMGTKDWLSWVLFYAIVGILVQVFAKVLE
jgi:hypothetical protein